MARRGKLNPETQKAICEAITLGNTIRDAAVINGVAEDTVYLWIRKGEADGKGRYFRFLVAIREAQSKHRALLKGYMIKAAPTDWKAAQAVGALTNPKEFVPQIRVHIERELDGVADALAEAFKDEPKLYERAMQAVIGRAFGVEPGAAPAVQPTAPSDVE